MRIGLISDTHGLVRPEALQALTGAGLIIHAGDVGSPQVLEALRNIAPVAAVRGNTDRDYWARELPLSDIVEAGGAALYVLHNIEELSLDPAVAGLSAVVYGHSHRPVVEERAGVLYVNPGSAGPRRFHLPVSVALLDIAGGKLQARIIALAV